MAKLRAAVRKGDIPRIRMLIEGGTSVNVTDPLGRTALHLAAEKNNAEMVSALLELRADVNHGIAFIPYID